jgi:diadenosine tetraphosphate (Ap4A) HIT family hydrolase
MAHIYKPTMLLAIIRNGGKADKRQIATAFQLRDTDQIEFYRRNVHPMPGTRLVRDGLLEKNGDTYSLTGVLATLNTNQFREVEVILEDRISTYMDMRNPFGDSNLDAIRGSVRYEVLKRAAGRCEACGVTANQTQIDVDHIVPRATGGSNDISNLQALCRTCNAQKRDRDDTNFTEIQRSYAVRDSSCVFCNAESRIIDENELAFVIKDGYEVTEHHSLVIPKRHVADYFELHMPERNAIEELLKKRREELLREDDTITGFNVGANVGESARQSVFHVHVHLIPRRDGDVDNPRGGVRHVIPCRGGYT